MVYRGGLLLAFLFVLWLPANAARFEPVNFHTDKGVFTFKAEIARSDAERRRGLMFRRYLPPDQAMLFDWGEVRFVHMWMQNTFIPLDMVFVGANGRVVQITANTVPHSLKLISSRVPVAAVIELNAGTAMRMGLKPGDRVGHVMFGKNP